MQAEERLLNALAVQQRRLSSDAKLTSGSADSEGLRPLPPTPKNKKQLETGEMNPPQIGRRTLPVAEDRKADNSSSAFRVHAFVCVICRRL